MFAMFRGLWKIQKGFLVVEWHPAWYADSWASNTPHCPRKAFKQAVNVGLPWQTF